MMKLFTKYILALTALLCISTYAWAGKVKLVVNSSPSNGGYVYANKKNENNIGTLTSDYAESDYKVGGSVNMYRFAKAADGYEFKGWADNDGGTPNSSASEISLGAAVGASTKTYTYYAIFAPITYTIAFNGNGSTSGTMSNVAMVYNTAKELTTNAFARQYTVTYNADGGTSSTNSASATYSFVGWAKSPTASVEYSDKQSVSNLTTNANATVTLYAQWKSASVVLPNATKAGAVIDGWYAEGVKVGEPGDNYTPTADVTLTAKWIEKYIPEITGNNYTLLVEGEQANAFSFKYTDNPTEHINIVSISEVNDGSGKVISYDAANNKIIAHNAGEATIYFTQSETETIKAGTSATYTITVSKHQTTFGGEAYDMMVEGTQIANYSYTNTSAAQPTASNSDSFYYTIDEVNFENEELNKGTDLITFNPSTKQITACNAGTAKITLHQKETYKYIGATASYNVTVNKHTPVFTLNPEVSSSPEKLYFNKDYPDYFTTTANSPLTLTSSDTLVAKWVQGSNSQSYTLKTFSKTNTATLTAIQHENYYWQRWEGSVDIQLQNARNHVPLKIESKDDMDSLWVSNTHNLTWDNGVNLQGGNYDDKFYVFKFEGYPKEITFNYTVNSVAVTGYSWSVEQSNENGNWGNKTSWSSGSYSGSGSLTLDKDTRYIRLCYSGNGHGKFYNISVSRLEEFYLLNNSGTKIDTLNFNIDEKGESIKNKVNNPCSTTVYFKYANIGHAVSLSTNDPQHFTLSKTSFNNLGGVKEGSEELTITYVSAMPYDAVDKELTIIDELGDTLIIPLIATTEKKEQTIAWNCDETLAIGQVVNDAATALSGGAITYSSVDEEIIKIIDNGTAFQAIAAGKTTVIATQAGNTEWKAVSDTLEFTVTGKKVQFIHWSDNLTRLKLGDAPITLTAIAEVLVDPENGVTETLPERTELITYTSADPNVVSVEGNVLTINGVGSTTITAELPGDAFEYEAATVSMPVTVTIPSNTCEAYVLNATEEVSRTYSLVWEESIYEPAAFTGPAHILTFEARKNNSTAVGNIQIQQYVNGAWQTIDDANPGTDWRSYQYELDSTATKIRFYNGYGSYTRYFKNVLVSQRTYLKTTTLEIVVDYSIVGDEITRPIAVQYSNISAGVLIEHKSNKITLSASELDSDCGKYGEHLITVYARIAEVGTIADTVTIHDEATGKKIEIPITISSQQTAQTLYWDAPTNPIESCSDLVLPTHTTADLALEWSVKDNSKNYADFDANGNLQILGTGTVTLIASNSGNNIYESFERTYTIRVVYNPIFLGAESDDWNTPSNWNICRVPEVAELASRNLQVQAPMTLTEELTVAGITLQEDASISIAETAGLTIGAEGITGTNADGSSIVIKNTPTGAGYLRVDPAATKPAKVTVDYTTKTYDNGEPRNEIWQYMGMPGNNAKIVDIDNQVSFYNWNEQQGWLKQNYTPETNIPAWTGYAFTQSKDKNATFRIISEPIWDDQTVGFTYTADGMKGDNLLVNSYLAPIDITKIESTDINDPQNKLTKTFFFFNAGSWNDWKTGAGDITADGYDQSSAGHYYSVPFYSAKNMKAGDAQLVIPSMQGVYIYTEGTASINLNYAKHVYGADVANNLNQPMRAPQQMQDDSFRRVCIQAVSENSGADRMYIMQDINTTPNYDNGYDGDNIMASGQVNIYTSEHFGKMEVSCSNDIDSTYIGFSAGEDSEYMLNFSAVVGDDIYLYDTEADILIPLVDGEQYSFYAKPNSVNNSRFMIIKQSVSNPDNGQGGVATDVENLYADYELWVYNNTVCVSKAPTNSSLSVFATNGTLLAGPYTITQAPYTLKLDLPAGVYMLRLNNQVYKFVCQ